MSNYYPVDDEPEDDDLDYDEDDLSLVDIPQLISDEALVKLRRFMEARELRDELEEKLKAAKEDYKEIEMEVHLMIGNSPVERLSNIDLGEPWGRVSFQNQETPYARVLDADVALEHYRKLGANYVVEGKLVGARLNEDIRRAEEEGRPLPPGLDSYKKRYVQITKQKGA